MPRASTFRPRNIPAVSSWNARPAGENHRGTQCQPGHRPRRAGACPDRLPEDVPAHDGRRRDSCSASAAARTPRSRGGLCRLAVDGARAPRAGPRGSSRYGCPTACSTTRPTRSSPSTSSSRPGDRRLQHQGRRSTGSPRSTLKRPASPLSDFGKGNVKARMRMVAQYAMAGEGAPARRRHRPRGRGGHGVLHEVRRRRRRHPAAHGAHEAPGHGGAPAPRRARATST